MIECCDLGVLDPRQVKLGPRKWGMTHLDHPENASYQQMLIVNDQEAFLFCRLSEPLLCPTAVGEELMLHLGRGRTVRVEPVPGGLVVCLSLKLVQHQTQEEVLVEPCRQSQ